MSEELERFPVPAMEFFEPKNVYTGSLGEFRYRIAMEDQKLKAYTYERFCFEVAKEKTEQEFEPDEAGLARLKAWLEAQHLLFLEKKKQ